MATPPTLAEHLVDEKRSLQEEHRQIESWLTGMRVGVKVEAGIVVIRRRPFLFIDRQEVDMPASRISKVPHVIRRAFYEFLCDRRNDIYRRIGAIDQRLGQLEGGNS